MAALRAEVSGAVQQSLAAQPLTDFMAFTDRGLHRRHTESWGAQGFACGDTSRPAPADAPHDRHPASETPAPQNRTPTSDDAAA